MASGTPSIARRKGARSSKYGGAGGASTALSIHSRQTILMLLALALALLIFTIGIAFGSRGIAAGGIPAATTAAINTKYQTAAVGGDDNSKNIAAEEPLKRVRHENVLRHPNQEIIGAEQGHPGANNKNAVRNAAASLNEGAESLLDDETKRLEEELQEQDDEHIALAQEFNHHILGEDASAAHSGGGSEKQDATTNNDNIHQEVESGGAHHHQLRAPPQAHHAHAKQGRGATRRGHDASDVGQDVKNAIHERQQMQMQALKENAEAARAADGEAPLDEESEAHLKTLLKAHGDTMKNFHKLHVRQGVADGDGREAATGDHIDAAEKDEGAVHTLTEEEETQKRLDEHQAQLVQAAHDAVAHESRTGIELNPFTRATLPNLVSNLFRSDGIEGSKVIFSAWIRFDPPEGRFVGIKRIFSVGPDIGGCHDNDLIHQRRDASLGNNAVGTGQSGMIRFYVNHDDTADACLILEWSPGAGRGCYTVEGVGTQVEGREWVHVGFSIDPAIWSANVYLNGELIADEQYDEAAESLAEPVGDGISAVTAKLVSDTSDPSSHMFLGRGMEQLHDEGQLTMTLDGRIALVSIWSEADTEQRILVSPMGEVGLLQHVYEEGHLVGATDLLDKLRSLQPDYIYPLNEGTQISAALATEEDVDIELIEVKDSKHGHLTLPFERMKLHPEVNHDLHAKDPYETVDKRGKGTDGGESEELNPFADFKPLGGYRYEEYLHGDQLVTVTPEMKEASDKEAREVRREAVKNAMKYSWGNYREYAFGFDEIKPITGQRDNGWKGMGVSLVDALDTLWLMDMKEEFWEARDWVRDHLSFDHVDHVGIFEITIRSLGGLLSAYDLSGDKAFLTAAEDLGSRLLHAFESPNGIPYGQTELNGHRSFNEAWQGGSTKLAECGTLQVEFRFLSEATANPIYAEKANLVFDMLGEAQPADGLYPLFVRNDRPGIFLENDHVTFGANADSFYEYMLKIWLQGGKNEALYRTMWDKAMKGVHQQLVQISSPTGLTYVAERKFGRLDHKMDHLACFLSGALALGAYTSPDGLESASAQRDLRLGKGLAYTCYQMYARTATGLSPELVIFGGKSDFYLRGATDYRLRPEVVESFFILYQLTGDPVYREWGWEVFQAIERYCRSDFGYGQYPNVEDTTCRLENKMESFFMAETLKYLYLLFDPDTEIDLLNTHVFNTEAHPLRRFDVLRNAQAA